MTVERETVTRSTPYGKTRMMERPFVVGFTATVVQGYFTGMDAVKLLTCNRCGATVLGQQPHDERDPLQVHTEWHARYR